MAYSPSIDLVPPVRLALNAFGAVGTGDDSGTIQAAINAVHKGGGGTILFQEMSLASERFDLRDMPSVALEGVGTGDNGSPASGIQAIGNNPAAVVTLGRNTATYQPTGGGVFNMRIDGNGLAGYGIQVLGLSRFRMSNLWLTNTLTSALDFQVLNSSGLAQNQDFILENILIDQQYTSVTGWSGPPASTTAHGITLNDNDVLVNNAPVKFANAVHDFRIDGFEDRIINGDAMRAGYVAIGTVRQGHMNRPATYYSPVVTISIGTPAIITSGVPAFAKVGDPFAFETTGALPSGITAGTTYYLLAGNQFSLMPGGSAINTTGSQHGVQTMGLQSYGRGLVLMDTINFARDAQQGLNNPCEHMAFDNVQVSVPGLFVLASYINNSAYPYQETPKWNFFKPMNSGNGSSAVPLLIVSDRMAVPIPTVVTNYLDDVPVVIDTDDGIAFGNIIAGGIGTPANYMNQVPALSYGRTTRALRAAQQIASGSQSNPAFEFSSPNGGEKQPQQLLSDDYGYGNACTIWTDSVSGNLNHSPTTGTPYVYQVLGTGVGPDGQLMLTLNTVLNLNYFTPLYVFGVGGTVEANNISPPNTQGNPTGLDAPSGTPTLQFIGMILPGTNQITLNNQTWVNAWTGGGLVIAGNAIVLPVTGVSANGSNKIRFTVPSTAYLTQGSAGRITTNGIGEGTNGSSLTSADFVNATITIVNSTTIDIPISTYNTNGGYNTTGYLVSPIGGAPPAVISQSDHSASSYNTTASFSATTSNNGAGLIRFTVGNGKAAGLQNGQRFQASGFSGVTSPNANGVWQVVDLDTTNYAFFDAVQSVWSGSTAGTGTVSWLAPVMGVRLLGVLKGANFNVTTDQPIALAFPPGATRFYLNDIEVVNGSTSLTTAQGAFYTAAIKGGTIIGATNTAYTNCTGASGRQKLSGLTNQDATTFPIATNLLYLSLTQGQGSAATADVYVYGTPYS